MIYCSLYDRNSFCIFRSPSSQRILFLKWIEILLVPPTSLIVSNNIPLISRMIGCDLGFQGTFGNRCFIVLSYFFFIFTQTPPYSDVSFVA